MCMFCDKQFQKLTRHQRRRRKEEPSVAAAMKLKAGSDEQILAFEKIRLLGDYHHNCNVLAVGEGELIVVRKPSKATPQAKFLPCPHCLGFFKGDELWRHCLVCQHKAATDEKNGRKFRLRQSFSCRRLNSRRRHTLIQKCDLVDEKRHHLMCSSPGRINYKLRGSHSGKSWH